MPAKKEPLPGTLERSPAKAQRIYTKTLDAAHEQYGGDEERAHRAAYASLKHSYEKVGDHWEAKARTGPSEPRPNRGGRTRRPTAGGVDVVGHTKQELYERARRLDVKGRSSMTKMELGQAIARAQD